MKMIISARSVAKELNNSQQFSFSLSFIFVLLAYNSLALGANCKVDFPEKIEKCKSLSLKVKNNCEFVAQEKIDQKALALLNDSRSTKPIAAGRGLLVLTGSKNANYKLDLSAEIKRCENTIGEYKQDCSGIVDELNTCMASSSVDPENGDERNAEALTSAICEAEENLASSQQKLSLSEEKLEKIETEIKKNIVNLCKNHLGPDLKSGCDEPSAEFTSSALQSFSTCSPSDERYDSNKCMAAVMPSVDLNANGISATSKANPTSEISTQPNQRLIASTEATPPSINDPMKAPEPAPAQAQIKPEPMALTETTLDSVKSSKNSDVNLPSFGTIAKYALLATLAYGAVTGKLKTWINKVVKAINPLANNSRANSGAGNANRGISSTSAAKISGVVNPPSQAERIAMRDRNRANGDGDGGGLDGGIYMQGAFELKTDANGVVISSNVIIHGTPGFTAVGRVKNDGLSILNLKESGIHDVGTLELIVKNNSVSGKMRHGGGKEWIYGDVVGSYSP